MSYVLLHALDIYLCERINHFVWVDKIKARYNNCLQELRNRHYKLKRTFLWYSTDRFGYIIPPFIESDNIGLIIELIRTGNIHGTHERIYPSRILVLKKLHSSKRNAYAWTDVQKHGFPDVLDYTVNIHYPSRDGKPIDLYFLKTVRVGLYDGAVKEEHCFPR